MRGNLTPNPFPSGKGDRNVGRSLVTPDYSGNDPRATAERGLSTEKRREAI
jgi:hypothetical protein